MIMRGGGGGEGGLKVLQHLPLHKIDVTFNMQFFTDF